MIGFGEMLYKLFKKESTQMPIETARFIEAVQIYAETVTGCEYQNVKEINPYIPNTVIITCETGVYKLFYIMDENNKDMYVSCERLVKRDIMETIRNNLKLKRSE